MVNTKWKWIIFFYQMCFVCCLLASSVFWITVIFYNDIYDLTADKEYSVLVSVHLVPTILMIIEYSFNLIPWDWRMLPFDFLIMLAYLLDTLLFQHF